MLLLGLTFETDDPEVRDIVERGDSAEIKKRCPKLIVAICKGFKKISHLNVPAASARYSNGKVTVRCAPEFACPPAIIDV